MPEPTSPPVQRLFVAAPLSPEVRDDLAAHLRAAAPGGLPGRAVPPRNWHFTLRFLGDTPAPAARALHDALAAAELGAPFSLGLGGYGAFPRPARASVLWLGVAEGAERLHALAHAVEDAARDAGFPPERRPFAPHLTLSRLRPPLDVRSALDRLPPFTAPLPVHEVVVYRSHLGAGPPRYESVQRIVLG